MTSIPHRLEQERATVPRIVLPITSRGLVVTDRVCWAILGTAMAAAATLILYLNRGTTFYFDELIWVYSSPDLGSVGDVLRPHNGHLIATTRLAYKAILETLGVEYLAFRVLAVSAVLLSAAFFYALVKRRIGVLPALAPTFVLLFLGSAWQHVLTPIGFTPVFSIAAGLAALLALERGDRRGDLAACTLLIVSVATYTTGLAFLVGAAASLLLRPDRGRRAWVFLTPLVLYAAWWVWSQSTEASSDGEVTLSNLFLIPNWALQSLATVTAAISGLGFDFADDLSPSVDPEWGWVLAAVAVVALTLRIMRGNVPTSLWGSLAIVLTWWALGALAFDPFSGRTPSATRYVYMGAVGVLLVATDAARWIRFSKRGLAVLFAACAVSLATNIAFLREGGASFRDAYATPARAEFAMLELARGRVSPEFDPLRDGPGSFISLPAATYFAAVDRYGSPALPLAELDGHAQSVRADADRTLADALGLHLEASPSGLPTQGCETFSGEEPGGAIGFELPTGGATLRARGVTPVTLTVGRFAPPSQEVGRLTPGEAATLIVPTDSSARRWLASTAGAASVEVCPTS